MGLGWCCPAKTTQERRVHNLVSASQARSPLTVYSFPAPPHDSRFNPHSADSQRRCSFMNWLSCAACVRQAMHASLSQGRPVTFSGATLVAALKLVPNAYQFCSDFGVSTLNLCSGLRACIRFRYYCCSGRASRIRTCVLRNQLSALPTLLFFRIVAAINPLSSGSFAAWSAAPSVRLASRQILPQSALASAPLKKPLCHHAANLCCCLFTTRLSSQSAHSCIISRRSVR